MNTETDKPRPLSSAERNAKLSRAARVLEIPELSLEREKLRAKLERDTAKWLRHFFPGIYRQPFGDVHHEIIDASEYTIRTGGKCVVAAPRGSGKSYVIDGVSLKACFTGLVRFPVVIPWDAKALRKALSFWKKALCFNDEIAALYPEFATVFRACRGIPQKVVQYTDVDGVPYGAELRVSEGMIVFPNSTGVIGGATINGNPLGLHYTTDSGEGLRPDLIFIDDPQDRDTALSQAQINSTIDLIDYDIAGMAGPDESMPMLMACTVKKRDDVAEHYLQGKEWRAVLVPQIVEWPEGFDDEGGVARKHWEAWNELRLDGEQDRDRGKRERAYFKKNKAEMVKGMRVSWADRYIHKDKPDAPKQPGPMYAALYDYFTMGHAAFMAERQNNPVKMDATIYELSPDMVCARMSDLPPLALPPETVKFVGHCDINRRGLHWCVAGFDNDMTCHVPLYGREPENGDLFPVNSNQKEIDQAIYAGLTRLCDRLSQTVFVRDGGRHQLDLLLIDAGWSSDVVHRFCGQRKYPFGTVAAIGRRVNKYRWSGSTIIGQPFEACHLQRTQNRRHAYAMFNSCHHRESSQRAFLGDAGRPGGVTLFKAPSPRHHMPFAEHVAVERLLNKWITEDGPRWDWLDKPGMINDWGDAYTGCWVAAALTGLTASGVRMAPPKKRKPRAKMLY